MKIGSTCTGRSLNACPYLALASPPCPLLYRAKEAATILTQGALHEVVVAARAGRSADDPEIAVAGRALRGVRAPRGDPVMVAVARVAQEGATAHGSPAARNHVARVHRPRDIAAIIPICRTYVPIVACEQVPILDHGMRQTLERSAWCRSTPGWRVSVAAILSVRTSRSLGIEPIPRHVPFAAGEPRLSHPNSALTVRSMLMVTMRP